MGTWYNERVPLVGQADPAVTSGLVKAREWMEWLDYWLPRIQDEERWVHFLLKTTIDFHQCFVVFTRRLRNNPNWDASTVEDSMSCRAAAEQRLKRYLAEKPSTIGTAMLPPWANILFKSLEGGLRQMVRLGGEIDTAREQGIVLVNVNPLAADGEDISQNEHAREE